MDFIEKTREKRCSTGQRFIFSEVLLMKSTLQIVQSNHTNLINDCWQKKMNSDRSSGQKANGSANVKVDQVLKYLFCKQVQVESSRTTAQAVVHGQVDKEERHTIVLDSAIYFQAQKCEKYADLPPGIEVHIFLLFLKMNSKPKAVELTKSYSQKSFWVCTLMFLADVL